MKILVYTPLPVYFRLKKKKKKEKISESLSSSTQTVLYPATEHHRLKMGDESHEKEGINGESDFISTKSMSSQEEYTLYAVLRSMIVAILFPDRQSSASSSNSLLHRIRASFSEHGPHLQQASRNTGRQVVLWTRRGSPLRAILVICVSDRFSFFLLDLLIVHFFVFSTFW